jgi:argininosuccinate lyase
VKPPSRLLVETAFSCELEAERALVAEISLADLAHTLALVEGGVLPRDPGRELLRALLELSALGDGLPLRPELGDLYTNREAWLAERTPAAGWLGAGRARREATTTAWLLLVRKRLLDLGEALVRFGGALVARALGLGDALAPDFTYLQPGQPTTAGHTLLASAYPVLRDLDRLAGHLSRVDRSPAGCGSANGSRLRHDRRRLAELLGFPDLVVHARDAMWQADAPIESLAVAVAAMVNADRLAEDLLFACAPGVGLFALSDAHCRASKILPQKRNPYALAHVRGVANRLIGVQAAVASAGRMPSGQVDGRTVPYAEVPRALADAAGALSLLASVVEELAFDAGGAAALLGRSFVAATDLAEVLMLEGGVDHRSAQRVVAVLARELSAAGRSAADLTAGDVAGAAARTLGVELRLPPRSLAEALDPRAAVAARAGPGGAAAGALGEMAAECGDALQAHAEALAARRARVAGAERALVRAARDAAGSP